jgi:hypothetical protein
MKKFTSAAIDSNRYILKDDGISHQNLQYVLVRMMMRHEVSLFLRLPLEVQQTKLKMKIVKQHETIHPEVLKMYGPGFNSHLQYHTIIPLLNADRLPCLLPLYS